MDCCHYRICMTVFMLFLWWALPASGLEVSCHIHPPAQEQGNNPPATTLGPFASESACDAVRQQLFGLAGRCHCAPGFALPMPLRRDSRKLPQPGEMQEKLPLP